MPIDWIIAIVGSIVDTAAVLFFLHELEKPQERKRITYSILLDSPLPPEEIEKAEIPPQEEPITDARLVIIQIKNTGRMAINPKDYYRPITFEFGEQVLRSEVGSIKRAGKSKVEDDIASLLRPGEQSVALETVRLKPKDQIFMSFLIAGPIKPIKVKGRIIDGGISEERLMRTSAP